MFQSIQIRNFRSCHDILLDDLKNVLVLIGRNGAGKSNILKAIEWASDIASNKDREPTGVYWGGSPEVEFVFVLGDEKYHYKLKSGYELFNVETKQPEVRRNIEEQMDLCGPNGLIPLFARKAEKLTLYSVDQLESPRLLEISYSAPAMAAVLGLLPEGDMHRVICEKATRFLSSVRYYPLAGSDDMAQGGFITAKDYKKSIATNFDGDHEGQILATKLLHLWLEKQDEFNEVRTLLGPNGLRVLEDIVISTHKHPEINRLPTDQEVLHFIRFRPASHSDNGLFSLSDLSFGTKRILSLVVAIIYDKSAVCLVEQPEDGIHPGLLNKLMPLLRSYSLLSQFIIATHSPSVLDRVTPGEVITVALNEGRTSARALDGDERGAADYFLKNDGPLSEFLRSIEED
jgi:predicted ATPase